MAKNESKKSADGNDEPTSVPGPAPYEEELKDYSKTSEEDLIDNMPDSHPEPSPTKGTNP
jgi:hypothetical protein